VPCSFLLSPLDFRGYERCQAPFFQVSGDQLCPSGLLAAGQGRGWRGGDTTLPTSREFIWLPSNTSPALPSRGILPFNLRSPRCPRLRQPGGGHPQRRDVPAAPLPPKNSGSTKLGTTGFMLAIARGAVAALLPASGAGRPVAVMAVLYGATVLGAPWGLPPPAGPPQLSWHPSGGAHPGADGQPGLPERTDRMGGAATATTQFSDQPNDHPDAGRGLWWTTATGCCHGPSQPVREVERFTATCRRDPFYAGWNRWFLMLQLPLGAALLGMAKRAGVPGGGLAWCSGRFPLRLVVVYHVTWLVNSAHPRLTATATSTSRSGSRNCLVGTSPLFR